jgi:hypothetical protein|tara:strand:- start:5773 stop:5931 length:159 start_codon:yes stop_codon:yes gene_type:complete
MNLTAILYPIYFVFKVLVSYPTEDIDIYIDAYRTNDTNDDDDVFKINWDYSK